MSEKMSAERFRQIARKLRTYADIYTGDKEAREMARDCEQAALLSSVTLSGEDSLCPPSASPHRESSMASQARREVAPPEALGYVNVYSTEDARFGAVHETLGEAEENRVPDDFLLVAKVVPLAPPPSEPPTPGALTAQAESRSEVITNKLTQEGNGA